MGFVASIASCVFKIKSDRGIWPPVSEQQFDILLAIYLKIDLISEVFIDTGRADQKWWKTAFSVGLAKDEEVENVRDWRILCFYFIFGCQSLAIVRRGLHSLAD